MDILFDFVSWIGSALSPALEYVTGESLSEQFKGQVGWVATATGAVLGLLGIWALVREGGQATKKDVRDVSSKLEGAATKADIEKLKAELFAALSAKEALAAPQAGMQAGESDGLGRELGAAIDTLLAAGKVEALRDKTGREAEAALDELIAERANAREKVAKDEAALWRQKGALAFLHDTGAALAAFRKTTELDPDDAEGWNQLGHLYQRSGELDDAVAAYHRVLALGKAGADNRTIAAATGNLGIVFETRGNLEKAEEMFRKALALNGALGSKEGMASNYGNLGSVFLTRGDLDEAEAMYRESLALFEALGSKEGVASVYGNLGIVFKRRGDLDKAEEMYRKSLAIEEALGRKEGMGNAYGSLGIVFRTRGDLDKAEEMYRKSLAIDEALGRKAGMATDYMNLGVLEKSRGNVLAACAHWATARDLFREIGMPHMVEKIEGWMREAGCGGS